MQLTIDIKDHAYEKVMYLLNSLKSDVEILNNPNDKLDIDTINNKDKDYTTLIESRKDRKKYPQNYGEIEDINWD